MLTVKLCNTTDKSMTIVETRSVDVRPINGSGKQIDCEHLDSGFKDSYEVKIGGKYDIAYVENARGSTVQVVKP